MLYFLPKKKKKVLASNHQQFYNGGGRGGKMDREKNTPHPLCATTVSVLKKKKENKIEENKSVGLI